MAASATCYWLSAVFQCGYALDKVEHAHAVPDWREHAVAIGCECNIALAVHCPAQVLEHKVGLHVSDAGRGVERGRRAGTGWAVEGGGAVDLESGRNVETVRRRSTMKYRRARCRSRWVDDAVLAALQVVTESRECSLDPPTFDYSGGKFPGAHVASTGRPS